MSDTDGGGREIGGIPLPKEYPKITRTIDQVSVFQHRTFGEGALPNYDKQQTGLRSVENTITGFEIAVQAGADAIEVDLMRTKDGRYVLNHPDNPLQKEMSMTAAEYLKTKPEAMTLNEMLDWLSHQDGRLKIYLELKSKIDFQAIVDEVRAVDPNGDKHLAERLMLYGSDTAQIEGYLDAKRAAGMNTDQLKLWWLTNGLVDAKMVDEVAAKGDAGNKIYGLEQGMMPWGTGAMVDNLPTFLGGLGKNFKDIVDRAHAAGLKIITGTVDKPEMINWLIKQGVDGVVPNNAIDFAGAGLERPPNEIPLKLATDPIDENKRYLPASMKQRLGIV